jgi:glycosyltransferase involved in cell wall biosynthesis
MTLPRVLTICHGHPDLVPGGTEHFAHDLHSAFARDGHAESYFLACVTGLHRASREGSALQSFDGRANEFLLRVGRFDPVMLCHAGDGEAIASLGRLLATLKPDVVHFHHLMHVGGESLALVKRTLPNARIVFTLHDFHPICAREGLMLRSNGDALCHGGNPDACHACLPDIAASRFALRRLHIGNLLNLVDRFVAPSATARERFVDGGIEPSRIVAIRNGVAELAMPETEPVSGPSAGMVFGCFGTMARHKGVLLALDAVTRLGDDCDATLSLFGDVSYQSAAFRAEFDRALRRTRGRAQHHGPYRRADLTRLMAGVDGVVVPSLWWENAPLVILESLRHRKPVIAADIGGMAELVQHGSNGLLFRRGDAVDLARAMSRAATETGLWSSLRAGIAPVATIAEVATAYARLYGELLEEDQRKLA